MAQNLGAQNPARSFAGLFLSLRFSLLFQLMVFIMMVPLSIPLAALFSQEQAVRDLLWHYLLVVLGQLRLPRRGDDVGFRPQRLTSTTQGFSMELYAPVCVHPTRSLDWRQTVQH